MNKTPIQKAISQLKEDIKNSTPPNLLGHQQLLANHKLIKYLQTLLLEEEQFAKYVFEAGSKYVDGLMSQHKEAIDFPEYYKQYKP